MKILVGSPVDPQWVKQAVVFLHTLPDLDKSDPDHYLDHAVFHWQVGTYGQTSCEYSLETYLDPVNNTWQYRITNDPRDNARTILPGMKYAANTYKRNSHGLGCAIAAMWGATPSDFGQYAVQEHEAEAFFAMCAAASVKYNLDPLDSDQEYTHAEAAIQDNYFPGDGDPDARWDWARTEGSSGPLTVEEANQTAHDIRQRVNLYKIAIEEALAV